MKLYTKTICPKCMWIKSEMAHAGVEAEIINLDQHADALEQLLQAGVKSVPVLEVNGQHHLPDAVPEQ